MKSNVGLQKLCHAGVDLVGMTAIGIDGKLEWQGFVHGLAAKDLGAGREFERSGGKRDKNHGDGKSREVFGSHRWLKS